MWVFARRASSAARKPERDKAVNAACVAAGKPLVSGAAIRLEGQLSVFDPRNAASPCYHCLYGHGSEAELTCSDRDVTVPMRVEYDLTAYPWAWLRATIAEPYQSTWVSDPDGSLVLAGSYRVYDDGYSRTVTLVVDQRVPTTWTIVDGRVTGAALHWARATMGPDMVCE